MLWTEATSGISYIDQILYAEERALVTLHVSIVRILMKEVGSATGITHIYRLICFYSVFLDILPAPLHW